MGHNHFVGGGGVTMGHHHFCCSELRPSCIARVFTALDVSSPHLQTQCMVSMASDFALSRNMHRRSLT